MAALFNHKSTYDDVQRHLNVVDCCEVILDGEQEASRLPRHFLRFFPGAACDAPQGQGGSPSLELKQRALREWRSYPPVTQLGFLKGLKGTSRLSSRDQSELDQNEADHQSSESEYQLVEPADNMAQNVVDKLDDAHPAAAAGRAPPAAMLHAGAADADGAPALPDAPVLNPSAVDPAAADAVQRYSVSYTHLTLPTKA